MTAEDMDLDLEALDRALSIRTFIVNVNVLLSQRDQYRRECETLRRQVVELRREIIALQERLLEKVLCKEPLPRTLDGEQGPAYVVGATNAQGAVELVRKWRDEPEPAPADYPTERTTL